MYITEKSEINSEKRLTIAKKAGKIHNTIRSEIKEWIKPGLKMIEISNKIENRIKELTEYSKNNPLKAGVAFPTGLSLNDCAAHWTPNTNETRILKKEDICKIDYGVHLEGMIIDSAFTISFDEKYEKLIEASETSTELAIKLSGPDTILGEIGAAVQENMESYEIELDNKIIPIKSIKTLTGHQIDPFKIHSGKSVPNFKIDYPERMKEGEYYAIETFGSTGSGITKEKIPCSHYMINYNIDYKNVAASIKEKKFLNNIYEKFGTLAFCNRWLDDYNVEKYSKYLNALNSLNIINKYPPLYDDKGSFTSQTEHTIYIKANGAEKISNL